MLHVKFQDHRTTGSGEADFKDFTIHGRGGHLGNVTWTIFPLPKEAPHKFLL